MRKRSQAPGVEAAAESGPAFPRHERLEPPASSRWQAAEARLYPLIMSDPDLYEAAVTLMSEARDVLRARCGTVTELAGEEATGVLAGCPSAAETLARGIDADVVVDAARAYRWRELTGLQPADRRLGSSGGTHR
jgi:hypothetical protein